MENLCEAYKKRIAISEQVYSRAHDGEKLSNNTKLATAKCLQNVEKFLNESFENSTGTQRTDLGQWKRFCLNLTTVALPNLIANDLVIVSPMSAMTGYVAYIEYVAGSNKGETSQNDVFNSPFALGKVDPNYTAARVVEKVTAVEEDSSTVMHLAWFPVHPGTSADVKLTVIDNTTHEEVEVTIDTEASNFEKGVIVFTDGVTADTEYTVRYVYDNVVIPQNDIPTVNARMQQITLLAHARRVAVYYSQIAAYQAKTDYGFDLGEQLAEKAVGQLSYEIDTEVVNLLVDHAENVIPAWSRTLPVGVSKTEHYEGFAEMVAIAGQKIYDQTKRFAPNYMIIASDILPILTFIKGFKAASTTSINGPYLAGTLNGLKVYVSPMMKPGDYVVGVNGNDMMSSAAVYAPYMAIVPTQLLQYADGGTSQGWSTLYDLKPLNVYTKNGKEYSRLLAKGTVVA